MKPLVIRADAGGHIGTGHVMRMIALAQSYISRGGQVTIVSVFCPDPIRERVLECGIDHVLIDQVDLGGADDVRATIQLCAELSAEWIVLDGYHFTTEYQRGVHGNGVKILAVDDYGHCEEWHADAVLNQNLNSEVWAERRSKVSDTMWLLGAPFALLREEFLHSTSVRDEVRGAIKNVLITLGGADPDNVTSKVLKSFDISDVEPMSLRVLVGGGNENKEELELLAGRSRHNVELLVNVRDMPEMYAWADYVVSAGGSTCWEWLYYGLKGAVITIANNQEPIVEALSERKLALDLGWYCENCPEAWAKQLEKWFSQPDQTVSGSVRERVIDGHGASRVVALLSGALSITIATAEKGWMREKVDMFASQLMQRGYSVKVVYDMNEIAPSDILLLLSFWSMVPSEVLHRNVHNLVVHESALPEGKGWSPMTWQVLEGKSKIPVTLFEAQSEVDSGPIYCRNEIQLRGDELVDELRELQALETFHLCEEFIESYPQLVTDRKQQIGESSFYSRRGPQDSELDIDLSLREQFNLLRTVDNKSYPAFFKHERQEYILHIEKRNK
ncbi:UDP-2,4-diacetamido-2,4,6-trideoxy-beta-L-altropyranose hydrolase [Rubritalea tangerina]|uniref:UDP-2,4-diacetamido-2,4, 6-trideoxy-beta-L-altropyranose hydrolase n=1 Tax=Rubritalea tangerina TaxID=430798 RepID=A0ABW4ZBH4_9BACT